jgi:hypothetical protein
MGTDWSRVAQWDGAKFVVVSDWYQADKSMIEPLVKEYGEKYAKEKQPQGAQLQLMRRCLVGCARGASTRSAQPRRHGMRRQRCLRSLAAIEQRASGETP